MCASSRFGTAWAAGQPENVRLMMLLEVRTEVLELVAQAAFAIDAGDAEGWADCFCADGVLRTSRPSVIEGRAALSDFARVWRSSRETIPRHMTWHHQLVADGEEVVGCCAAAVLAASPGGVAIELTASYRDRYRVEEGKWRIAERVVELDRLP